VEGRCCGCLSGRFNLGCPQPALDVGQDVAQLGLGLCLGPTVRGTAQRDEMTPAVRAEAQGEDAPDGTVALDDLAC
jgi:hypothetical protein